MELDDNQYRIITEHMPNMIMRSIADGTCDYFNSKWLRFTGRQFDEEIGDGWRKNVHSDDFDRISTIYLNAYKQKCSFEIVYRLQRYDSEWRWIAGRCLPYFNNEDILMGYIGSFLDVTEMIVGENLREMAQKDGLTGINSRQYFEQLAKAELEKAKRYRTDICAVMTDINHFKHINDTYGHITGDNVLKSFAKFLAAHIRDMDIIGRYGGDEFAVLLPNTNRENAVAFMTRLNKLLESPLIFNDVTLQIGFCFGIASMERDDTLETLLLRADLKMYLMKKTV